MLFIKKLFVLFFSLVLSFVFFLHVIARRSKATTEAIHKRYEIASPSAPNDVCTFVKWFDPNTNDKEGKLLLKNCSSCHMAYYKEWIDDKHSMSQNNPLFLAAYKQFREDHPDQNGNCALCHNPEAAIDNDFNNDVRAGFKPAPTNGISCDFCHKIESVNQDPLKKGVSGLNIVRACKGMKDIRFGPIKDPIQPSNKEELRYNSLYKTSLVCAKCHDGSNGNVQIYSTFSEWINSPASKRGVQCQACHMKPRERNSEGVKGRRGEEHFIVDNPEIKRKSRPYYQIHNHRFLTENPHEFRKKYVDLNVGAGLAPAQKNGTRRLTITAKVSNNNFGHSFPTGSTMRNAILVIDVKCNCRDGVTPSLQPIQIKGPKLPNYAGNLKDKSGKLFAKILSETSGEYATAHGTAGIKFRKLASKLGVPAQDWWNVFIQSDTRIKANGEDVSTYEFEIPPSYIHPSIRPHAQYEITAKLIWRNTWPGLAKIKKIKLEEDVLVEKKINKYI